MVEKNRNKEMDLKDFEARELWKKGKYKRASRKYEEIITLLSDDEERLSSTSFREQLYSSLLNEAMGDHFLSRMDYNRAIASYNTALGILLNIEKGGQPLKSIYMFRIYLKKGLCFEKLWKDKETIENYELFMKFKRKARDYYKNSNAEGYFNEMYPKKIISLGPDIVKNKANEIEKNLSPAQRLPFKRIRKPPPPRLKPEIYFRKKHPKKTISLGPDMVKNKANEIEKDLSPAQRLPVKKIKKLAPPRLKPEIDVDKLDRKHREDLLLPVKEIILEHLYKFRNYTENDDVIPDKITLGGMETTLGIKYKRLHEALQGKYNSLCNCKLVKCSQKRKRTKSGKSRLGFFITAEGIEEAKKLLGIGD